MASLIEKDKRSIRFNVDILDQKDGNGDVISSWCVKGFKPEEGLCTVCNVTISCKQHGVSAVKSHAQSKKHMDLCKKIRNENGLLKKSCVQARLDFSQKNSTELSHNDNVTLAETLFSLTVAEKNLPYSFVDTASEVLPKMFHDSKIARDFSISRTKVSYIISDGIGPYFKDCFIRDLHKYGTFYSILVDETPVSEKRVQQFDVLIRYYSESSKKIVTKHLESFHLGHATADILFNCIEKSTSNLPVNKLVNFQSDGPNVMKSLKSKIKACHPYLLDIGECCLHKVHNAFAQALTAFGGDIESLLVDVYYFFKGSSAQSSDFRQMQCLMDLPDHIFVRHVSSRWLTIETSLSRFVEQFEALEKFFKSCSSKRETVRLHRIQEAFSKKSTLVKALLLKNACSLFTNFLKLFQSEDPLIHTLYEELVTLVKGIMGRFLISDSFCDKSGVELKEIDVEKSNIWRKKIEIGLDTECKLKLLSEGERKDFTLGSRLFYITSVKYLLRVLPFENKILEQLKCLHPVFVKEPSSVSCIRNLAAKVPNIIPADSVSALTDEWILLQSENLSDICGNNYQRIDQFWNKIFDLRRYDGNPKFENIPVLIKALLSLPHGNADCERGFSINSHMLDNRVNLSIHSINGIRSIKSHLQEYGKIKDIEVSSEFLRSVKNAHKSYQQRIEKEKAEIEAKALKRKIEDTEISLKEKEKDLQKQLEASQKVLNNAERMIEHGLKRKSFTDIQSGQILLKDSKEKIATILKELEKIRSEQHLISKKIKT